MGSMAASSSCQHTMQTIKATGFALVRLILQRAGTGSPQPHLPQHRNRSLPQADIQPAHRLTPSLLSFQVLLNIGSLHNWVMRRCEWLTELGQGPSPTLFPCAALCFCLMAEGKEWHIFKPLKNSWRMRQEKQTRAGAAARGISTWGNEYLYSSTAPILSSSGWKRFG